MIGDLYSRALLDALEEEGHPQVAELATSFLSRFPLRSWTTLIATALKVA